MDRTPKALVKKPQTGAYGAFNDPVPDTIPEGIRDRFEEICQLPEPFIEAVHRNNFSIQERLRPFVPQALEVQCVDLTADESGDGEANDARQRSRVPATEDDHRPLMRLAHIPRHHFAESLFPKPVAQWTKNLACLWGTYGGMREHNMVGDCRCGCICK